MVAIVRDKSVYKVLVVSARYERPMPAYILFEAVESCSEAARSGQLLKSCNDLIPGNFFAFRMKTVNRCNGVASSDSVPHA